jgi:hypothetical protein
MSDLVVIEKKKALHIFTEPGALDPILHQIEKEALLVAPDVATVKGRKDIASIAYKVAQAKTYIDGVGKDLVAEMKELPKKVDAGRKQARDFLDELKDKVRKPLDDWEAEQERIEAEKKAAAEAAALAKQIEHDHEVALLMNAEFDRQREAEKAAAEQARIEREHRIAQEAAERARQEVEARAKAEAEAQQRAVVEAEIRARKAEEAKQEAERREQEQARLAAERIEREKLQAAEAERKRIAAEEEAKRRADEERARDTENRRRKNLEALADMREHSGLNDEQAKSVLIAIAKGQVRNVRIAY